MSIQIPTVSNTATAEAKVTSMWPGNGYPLWWTPPSYPCFLSHGNGSIQLVTAPRAEWKMSLILDLDSSPIPPWRPQLGCQRSSNSTLRLLVWVGTAETWALIHLAKALGLELVTYPFGKGTARKHNCLLDKLFQGAKEMAQQLGALTALTGENWIPSIHVRQLTTACNPSACNPTPSPVLQGSRTCLRGTDIDIGTTLFYTYKMKVNL